MKTIIFDIDGTLTSMWPIEKAVLEALLSARIQNKMSLSEKIESIKQSGISETYKIFSKISAKHPIRKIGRSGYVSLYNQAFAELEKSGSLPQPIPYPTVAWIKGNQDAFHFVYATGGQKAESEFVLKELGLFDIFDQKNSISKTNYRFAKKTGRPLQKIKRVFPDCFFITDSTSDCVGAHKAGVAYKQIKPNDEFAGITSSSAKQSES